MSLRGRNRPPQAANSLPKAAAWLGIYRTKEIAHGLLQIRRPLGLADPEQIYFGVFYFVLLLFYY